MYMYICTCIICLYLAYCFIVYALAPFQRNPTQAQQQYQIQHISVWTHVQTQQSDNPPNYKWVLGQDWLENPMGIGYCTICFTVQHHRFVHKKKSYLDRFLKCPCMLAYNAQVISS